MSMCDNCIHDEVCGLEDNHEEAITFCANMIPKDILDKIRSEIEALEDKMLDVPNDWRTSEVFENVLDVIDKYIGDKE